MKKLTGVMALALLVLMGGTASQTGRVPAASNPPPEVHGVKEFFASGDFTVPEGVTSVMVEMWGGGGGGFVGSETAAAGGGGGGAYTRSAITVVPGRTYSVIVGAGGAAGGGNGGTTRIDAPAAAPPSPPVIWILVYAGGGQGGRATAGGAGGEGDPQAAISHPGFPGQYYPDEASGPGGVAYAWNLTPNAGYSGNIGFGGFSWAGNPVTAPRGDPGGPGYVLITW
jgi:hypothetical protein